MASRDDLGDLGEEQEKRLAAALALGIEDVEAGRTRPAAEVFDRLIAKYEALASAKGERSTPARPHA